MIKAAANVDPGGVKACPEVASKTSAKRPKIGLSRMIDEVFWSFSREKEKPTDGDCGSSNANVRYKRRRARPVKAFYK